MNSVFLKIMFSGSYIFIFSNILSFRLFFTCFFIIEDTSDKMDGKNSLILFNIFVYFLHF